MPNSEPETGRRPRRDIDALVAAMTLDEKAALTAGVDTWHTAAVPRLGIPAIKLTDGPNGARGKTADHLSVTPSVCIPCATALGATWDPDLVRRASAMVARQAREKGARVLLAPTVNLHRHPLWGRNFEAFSEDPLLTSKLACAYIEGVQSQGVVATVKHFVGNEVEFERNTVTSEIDERTLREMYLLPFEYAVKVAGVLSVMTSYNRVNGKFVPDDRRLLHEILREEWGFDGFVMTDWFGIVTTADAARAGLDLEMPGPARAFGATLAAAVRDGVVDVPDVDAKARHLLNVFDRVGALDDPGDGAENPIDRVEDRALARTLATDSIVLLANNGVLPIAATTRVFVSGPNADRLSTVGGGSARVVPHYTLSFLDVVRERFGASILVDDAAAADLVIAVVGTDGNIESEGYDRDAMRLPAGQDALVERLIDTGKPVAVVVNSGSPVDLPWADRVSAVLQTWFGGQELANAIVDVLLGEAEPAGRLPTSWPLRLEHTPAYGDFPGENSVVRYSERLLVGYRWYDTRCLPVRFPFGHGLSYTEFRIGEPGVSARRLAVGQRLRIEVDVENVGRREGAEVVQLYVAPPAVVRADGERHLRPSKELKAFSKVRLAPGQSTNVAFELSARSFAHYDEADQQWPELSARMPPSVYNFREPVPALHRSSPGWYVESGIYRLDIGRSAGDIARRVEVAVDGGDEPLHRSTPLD